MYAAHLVEELRHFELYFMAAKKDNSTNKFYYGSLDELKGFPTGLFSRGKAFAWRIPEKELVVGGRFKRKLEQIADEI